MREWLSKVRALFGRGDIDEDLRAELDAHLQMEVEGNVDRGMTPEDALNSARRNFGNPTLIQESSRETWSFRSVETLLQDIRYALRLLRRAPGFAAVVVATLALGIGANTAIFSIIDSLLLRALPVKEPGRLTMVTYGGPIEQGVWTNPIWEEIRQHSDAFDGAFAWSNQRFDLAHGGETQFVDGIWASGSMFATLGVSAMLGRTFTTADDLRGGGPDGPVAVISHAFWQRHFGGTADVIGRTLTLDRIPFTIIGVTPSRFFGPEVGRSYDVAVPIGAETLVRGPNESRLDRRSSWWLSVMVRLKPSQTLEQGTMVVRRLQPQIREATLPTDLTARQLETYLGEPFTLAHAATGRSFLRRQYQRPLLVVMVVVSLVLLIACANIANLLLARATARCHEWSVRLAVGASRWRIARQLLTESLILSAIGAAGGIVVARWGSRLLVRQLSTESVSLDLTLDWRVLAFTSAIAVVTALVFGVAPALRAAGVAPVDALKEQGRSDAGSGRFSAAGSLIVAQVVLSVVLVVAAGLFLRTFSSLASRPLGLESNPVLLVDIDSQPSGIPPEARLAIYEQVRTRVLAVPGVASAGASRVTPVSRGAIWGHRVDVSGVDDQRQARFNAITPGWLTTLGMRLIAGRDVAERDGPTAARVALVNEAFAQNFLNGANPIGHTLRTTGLNAPPPREIVGMVADAVYSDLRESVPPTVYVPLAQFDGNPPPDVTLSVRAASESPALLTRSVSAAIANINPSLALTFRPLADHVSDTLIQERLLATLSAFFGVLALLLAGVGLYGVTSYAVGLRRAEIGIRMALGATGAAVVRLVLGRVLLLVGTGILVGLVVSAWASRFVTTLLHGVEPGDTVTLVSSAVVLAIIGVVAGWLPARRASRLQPAKGLCP